jgi:hypothetical protein
VNALGPIPVKRLTEPVEVFELVGASAVRRRLQAVVARGLTRFVGRETEIAALVQALARAVAGHGQCVARWSHSASLSTSLRTCGLRNPLQRLYMIIVESHGYPVI